LLTQAFGESKGVKQVLKYIQGGLNNTSGTEDVISGDTPEVQEKLKTFAAKPSIANGDYGSKSIMIDPTKPATPFSQSFNNWSDRERAFTNNLTKATFVPTPGETSLKGEKLDKNNVKVIFIHKDNQDNFGFNNFHQDSYTPYYSSEPVHNTGDKRNVSKAQVAEVYIYDNGGDFYTMDKEGKLLQKIDKNTKQDLDNVVFTYLDHLELEYQASNKGEAKYYDQDKFKAELPEIKKKAFATREALLDNKGIYPYNFEVSAGKLNVTKDNGKTVVRNNSVVESKILTVEDLNVPKTLQVATVETSEKPGFAKINGKYIPLAVAYVVDGSGNPIVVNTRRMHEKDAINIYNIIKKIASGMYQQFADTKGLTKEEVEKEAAKRLQQEGDIKTERNELLKYLRNVLFFRKPMEGRKTGRNQIYINDAGEIVIGKTPIKMSLKEIESRKDDLIRLIMGSGESDRPGLFHNVNQWTLNNEHGAFTEIHILLSFV